MVKRNVSFKIGSSNEERIASCGSRSEIQHVPATLPASQEKCKKCATKCVARHSHWKDNLKFNSASLKKNTQLHLTRKLTYHLVQTYIPSTVFVVIAWLSLFVPPESVPGRVGMGMTTLLTLTAMFSSVRQNVPRVSYISLLDIWMLVCMIFVFTCILEFIVVTAHIRSGKKNRGEMVESVSKIVIPILFVTFNAIYWPIVLIKYVDNY